MTGEVAIERLHEYDLNGVTVLVLEFGHIADGKVLVYYETRFGKHGTCWADELKKLEDK